MVQTASKPERDLASSTRIIIPTYGTQSALDSLLEELPSVWLKRCIVVDDGSPVPIRAPEAVKIIRHPQNLGYGAAQKSGYCLALDDKPKYILMIHGDNQYSVSHSLLLLSHLKDADIVLGSRHLWPQSTHYPAWRKTGNRLLTRLSNWRFKRQHTDLHSGARAYTSKALNTLDFDSFSNSYLFDQQLLLSAFKKNMRLAECPMPPKYDETVLRIAFVPALRYALGCLLLNLR